ncbi:diguanylate cyclase (GGDEF)-like protein/PAS domain S-box-containing protein [Halomonas fontilapidosi]|uniref:Diguanylate cyclase (GGDEF)-like protein/PAS domain S-box-containing protein n=1 Tax=Halomonas fontilapidosi TaxID=616675 RepID=A0A7W5DHP8_9GAMM|nr:EAL domain-containing protein [Halomonas fontilapidosi]MBB3182851.1 diguanylate cyclase (GGDEF)-like protein/PAS domain S-box-containing protein [Halomonas fontilapidosi]
MTHELPVERIMHTGLLTCTPQTPLCEAAARMAERRCSSMLVMQGGQAVGIWTEHDSLFVDFADPEAVQCPIERVMNRPVATIHQATPVGEAALRFTTERRRHLLVVDDAGTPQGILSQSDMVLNQGLEPYLRLREVGGAMRSRPLLLQGELTLNEAAQHMRRSGCDAAVVISPCQPLGILTERDLVRFVARRPGATAIGELASRPLLTVRVEDALIHARDLLIDQRVRHLGVLDSQGEVVGLLGFQDMLAGAEHLYLEDLREALEQRDQALAQSRRNLQLAERVIDSSLEGIIITDAQTRIEFVNPAFIHMTGYSLEEAVGRTPAMLSSGRHGAEFYRDMWRALQEHGYWRGEIWNRRKGGQLYLELLTITAIRNEQGEITNFAALFTDITHIRENEEQVRRLAYYDPLTRLPNRRLLEDRLELAIRHAHRHRQRLAVIFLDLDHFKQVNDALGHAVGDELLLKVSQRLRAHLREDDTLARQGGDEFIVLVNEVEEVEEVMRVAHRLVDSVSAPFEVGGQVFRVGCSLGISLYPDDGAEVETLVRNADAAMYRAKQEGRNTFRLFRPEMHQQEHRRLELETALRNTAETGEGLAVHYQPLFDRDSGELQGAEALLRWHHPQFGQVSPADFIPLAERSGLILPLGERLMHLVAGQLRDWLADGLTPPRIAVNLSARQFWQSDLVAQVQELYAAYGLPPGQIGFELTESLLLDKHQQAIHTLQALRELDCFIAIDDFGTGYSSLSYLQELPVTTLKIDRSFIQKLGESRGSAAIVAAVTGLAKELGLRVVAEGVETEAQLAALSRYHVTLIQGYLTGHPVDAETFANHYLDTQRVHA